MTTGSKIVLSWWDLCLLLLLAAGGLGVWLLCERQVNVWHKGDEPREETLQLKQQVPARQAELALAQDQLIALRAKLTEQRLERERESAAYDALLEAFPQLKKAAGSDLLTIRLEALQLYSQARVEEKAAAQFLGRLEADLTKLIQEKIFLATDLAGQKPGTSEFLRKEARLSACVEQLSATQKKLAEVRVERARQEVRAEGLAAANPALKRLDAAVGEFANLPLDAAQLGTLAPGKRLALDAHLHRLESLLPPAHEEVKVRLDALVKAQQQTALEWAEARESWNRAKLLATFGLSSLCLLAALGVVWLLCLWVFGRQAWFARQFTVGVAALGVLGALYVYQALEVVGAAALAVVLLLVIQWRLRPGAATAAKAPS